MKTALLIDAENLSAACWPQVLQQVGRKNLHSSLVVADFGDGRCKIWREIAEREGLRLVMQPGGSNATDIAITIAAMEILHSGKFDTVFLASSDRDYAPLALYLKQMGMTVVGLGEAKSSPCLRAACSRFFELKPAKLKAIAVKKAA
jgi:hypothetical protein